jgi:hypothetical protein
MPRCRWKLTIVAMASLLVVACSTPPPEQASASTPALVACEDPRPQICTADYDPVCGRLADGSYKTYANACSACGDAAVSGHRPGACE